MKPFDLEAFKAGATALTRDGIEAKFVAIDTDLGEFPLVFSIHGLVYQRDLNGLYGRAGITNSDLVAIKTTATTFWINFYRLAPDNELAQGCCLHSTKEEALKDGALSDISTNKHIGAFPIEIEE